MAPGEKVDQIAFVIVSGRQSEDLMQHLIREHFYFTRIDSSGGILQEATICLLIGLNHAQMPVLFDLAEKYCHPFREFIPAQISLSTGMPPLQMIEAQSGGALVYVLDVEQFVQL